VLIDFHRKMLADRVRHDAYREALARVLVPGRSTVADLGAGTGVLSFFARELGARECWLYEPGAALQLAETIAARNGIDGLHFVAEWSHLVEDPPRVDVVVAEVFGNFALEEGVLETLADAQRYLAPGGRLIPGGLEQWVAPVASERFERELRSWREVGHGLDLADAEAMSRNNMYVQAIEPGDLLPVAPRRWDALDFSKPQDPQRRGSARWQLASSGTVAGFALWWDALLVPGVTLSTSPHAPRTHWDQVYLPLAAPLALAAGDALAIEIASETGGGEAGIAVAWRVVQERAGRVVAEQQLDIGSGYLD
jgi:protein arginine N-methyltransferase 1